ncbi:HTH domain-containing protein [Murimonas intestini]|nr:HTH domain-containing protein [Murimonas intestini]MCR1842645.1 HTH domain-containing protein [Murimonas intestini]MCR1867308.1 HTH domain-containing protein [Murimonas intestini]MCR1884495.1 HTH domain-containing protein [Murimonas intestini]
MQGSQRREQIMTLLSKSGVPVTGRELAGHFGVSRQVIVQDIALLRASGKEILSTTTGYLILRPVST